MINWDQVAQLREDVGADAFEEVVELFLDEVDQVTERLTDFGALVPLQEDLHFLKGSALNLGFAVFGERCQACERMAAGGQSDDVPVTDLVECYRLSRRIFLDGIAKRDVA